MRETRWLNEFTDNQIKQVLADFGKEGATFSQIVEKLSEIRKIPQHKKTVSRQLHRLRKQGDVTKLVTGNYALAYLDYIIGGYLFGKRAITATFYKNKMTYLDVERFFSELQPRQAPLNESAYLSLMLFELSNRVGGLLSYFILQTLKDKDKNQEWLTECMGREMYEFLITKYKEIILQTLGNIRYTSDKRKLSQDTITAVFKSYKKVHPEIYRQCQSIISRMLL
jgi:hypothetical protein